MIEMRHADTTERIIRCAIDVHKALGPGHPVEYYTKALVHELEISGLPMQADVPVRVTYKDVVIGERRVPIIVQDVVAILPCTQEIDESAIAEAVSLLRATELPVGLILNFAKARLDIRRVAN